MQALLRSVTWLTSRNDIVLAVLIVSIIFMMILPLPTVLIDVLIGTNMTVAAILLMVAMYLPSPLAFSSFPSVLLITTLFRLGISIATTRLILLQADAGHIIETFGNFVVGGNLVVGLVVFLILTIVQFIVITKGAERVAEVAARFSLDAMPGKQMAIDADLRAGAIDMDEARQRRSLIEKESQLYGAMDGAMKFVKGDAIAGMIIVAVNLLGGIIIGTMQRGMTAAESVQVYSILTVGDGLITQIPALFIAICAGIIVTRVQAGGEPSNVGKDIGAQILAQPKALLIAAGIAGGMGLIPGMPTLTFLLLAAATAVVGYVLVSSSARKSERGEAGSHGTEPAGGQDALFDSSGSVRFMPTVPVIVDLAVDLRSGLDVTAVAQELAHIRSRLYFDLGISIPEIHLRFNEHLPENSYCILLFEIPVEHGYLRPGYILVREAEQNLKALQIAFETDRDFLPRIPSVWVKEGLTDTLEAAGMAFMRSIQILSWHLTFVLKKHAGDFVGIQETRFMLESLEAEFPELAREITRLMPLQKVAEILQRLVSEEISVRNLRAVIEALLEWGQREKDSILLTEYVRVELKRYISYKYANEQNLLPAYLFAPAVEEVIRGSISQTMAGSYLALDPDINKGLMDNIRETVGAIDPASKPVLLTSMDIRRYVRKMIEIDLYDLPVLSYQELTSEVNVQPLGRVEMPASGSDRGFVLP